MTEPTLEGLQRELRALRRTLYVTLSIAGALSVAMIASCATKAAPPTHLTFGDANHKVDIDADGMFIVEGPKSVRITAGEVNATDAIYVHDEATGTASLTPTSLRVGTKEGTAVLEVRSKLGVSFELQAADKSVKLFTTERFAGVTAKGPDHDVTSAASESYALVSAHNQTGPQVSLSAGAGGACAQVERLGDDRTRPSKLCTGPAKSP